MTGRAASSEQALAVARRAVVRAAIAVAVSTVARQTQAPDRSSLADCVREMTADAMRRCYTSRMLREVRGERAPTAVLTRIDRDVNRMDR